ncbi:LCP family protein [Nanchangia anserum]|uniref:LCP family protein n=1 Tax=Nanchangia anserum TaxID=2692125 RepID=UPI0030B85C5A
MPASRTARSQAQPQTRQSSTSAPPAYPPQARRSRDGAPIRREGRDTEMRPRPAESVPPRRDPHVAPPARRRRRRWIPLVALVIVCALFAWPLYLLGWANSQITHVPALSSASEGEGTTWLIAGSDRRSDGSDGGIADPTTTGARTDSLMLVRRVNGTAMIVSLPRDTAVEIPGKGTNKINAAYSLGGPTLLVKTVEHLTGLKIDHYVEVSMGALTQIVDAVGGVNLCSDLTVNDRDSGLVWSPGCHTVDGKTALAFARMRKSDPNGDIGRADRQRQVIAKTVDSALSASSVVNPFTQHALSGAVASSLITDPDTGIVSLGLLGWNYRKAQQAQLTGTPPLSSLNYRDGVHGSMVSLDSSRIESFWSKLGSGTLTPDDYWKPPR